MRVHDESITIKGNDMKDYINKEKYVRKLLGKRSYFLRKVYYFPLTKWLFQIQLTLLKFNIKLSFLMLLNIEEISIAKKKGYSLDSVEGWDIKKVFSRN
jgi:5'(3')-deoxyribonucleotidase